MRGKARLVGQQFEFALIVYEAGKPVKNAVPRRT
jgi:hypothetical protein